MQHRNSLEPIRPRLPSTRQHISAEAVGAQEREARLRRMLVQVLHTPLELAIADHADLSTRYSP
jgi:hypothetical protein